MGVATNVCNACKRERRTLDLEVRREGPELYVLICIEPRGCIAHAKQSGIWK